MEGDRDMSLEVNNLQNSQQLETFSDNYVNDKEAEAVSAIALQEEDREAAAQTPLPDDNSAQPSNIFRNESEKLVADITKQSLRDRLLTSSANEALKQKEQGSNESSAVAAGIAGANAAQRKNQKAQEIYGYPSRSEQSDKAARILENVIAPETKRFFAGALGAQIREDGTIVLAVSGGDVNKVQTIYDKYSSPLQQRLNEVFRNDPLIAKDANGNVKFEFGPANAATDHLNKKIRFVDNNFIISTYKKDNRICVEDRLFQATNNSKAQSMTVIWRTEFANGAKPEPNKYIERLDNPDNKVMVPCVSCKTNAEAVMSAKLTPQERAGMIAQKRGSQMATGAALGATISAGVYTFNQVMEGRPIESDALARESGVGAASGIAGNYIEKFVADRLLRAPEATLTVGQLVPRQAIGAGVAGGVVGGGVAAYQNFDNFQQGKITGREYGSKIGKEVVFGFVSGTASTIAGASIGGTIGSALPVAGTAVGIVAGAVIGYAVDQTVRLMVDGKPTEKVVIPLEAFNQGLQFQIPVYSNDRQLDVVTRTFEMMAKSVGLPNNEVENYVMNWRARYQLGERDKMVFYSANGTREVTDAEFEQIKTRGYMISTIKGDTHADLINDLKNRLTRVAGSAQQ